MVKTFQTSEQLLQVLQTSLAEHEDIVWELEEQEGGFAIRPKGQVPNVGDWQTPLPNFQLLGGDAFIQSIEATLLEKLNSLGVIKTPDLDQIVESILKEMVDNISRTLSATIIQGHNKKGDNTGSTSENEDLEQWIAHFTTKYDKTLQKLAIS